MRFDAPVRDRPLFVTARGAARGVELSARRLAGRTTASVGYTYATSTLDALGYHYFSPQDRRHAVDLSLARRLGESWRLAAAFSGATGAPYTRIRIRPNYENVDPLFDAEAADAERRPPSFLLGTEAEWTHRFTRWQLGAYGQLQSALTSQSSGSYRGDNCTLDTPGEVCVPYSTAREPTFAILPTLGLRFAF
jgi:hypothetical protein